MRAKKFLTLDQHRRLKDAIPNYLMVKSNAGSLGCTVDGCQELAQFVNVFAHEPLWALLGPAGAAGCCSSMAYRFPHYMQLFWKEVEAKD